MTNSLPKPIKTSNKSANDELCELTEDMMLQHIEFAQQYRYKRHIRMAENKHVINVSSSNPTESSINANVLKELPSKNSSANVVGELTEEMMLEQIEFSQQHRLRRTICTPINTLMN